MFDGPPTVSRSAAVPRRRLVAGAVAAIAALLLIVGSFLTWASVSDTFAAPGLPGNGTMTVEFSMTITGMGSLDRSTDISGVPDELRDGLTGFLVDTGPTAGIGDEVGKRGLWTVIFGVVIAVGAALMAGRRFPGIGAVITTLSGLAACIAAVAFATDPLGAVEGGDGYAVTADVAVGSGLWMALVGAVLGLLAGVVVLGPALLPPTADHPAAANGSA